MYGRLVLEKSFTVVVVVNDWTILQAQTLPGVVTGESSIRTNSGLFGLALETFYGYLPDGASHNIDTDLFVLISAFDIGQCGYTS